MGNYVNAFWKSRRMASVRILLSILCARLSMSWISCISVGRCFLNPCCASWRMLCVSRCCMILLVMCSSILQVMDVSEIRWQTWGDSDSGAEPGRSTLYLSTSVLKYICT